MSDLKECEKSHHISNLIQLITKQITDYYPSYSEDSITVKHNYCRVAEDGYYHKVTISVSINEITQYSYSYSINKVVEKEIYCKEANQELQILTPIDFPACLVQGEELPYDTWSTQIQPNLDFDYNIFQILREYISERNIFYFVPIGYRIMVLSSNSGKMYQYTFNTSKDTTMQTTLFESNEGNIDIMGFSTLSKQILPIPENREYPTSENEEDESIPDIENNEIQNNPGLGRSNSNFLENDKAPALL